MFFHDFLGGITLKIIPSENGSRESTNSSSALPPKVIICRSKEILISSSCFYGKTQVVIHLIHLLELHADNMKSDHKLFQALFTHVVIPLLGSVSSASNTLQILSSLKEFLFPPPILF